MGTVDWSLETMPRVWLEERPPLGFMTNNDSSPNLIWDEGRIVASMSSPLTIVTATSSMSPAVLAGKTLVSGRKLLPKRRMVVASPATRSLGNTLLIEGCSGEAAFAGT